MKYKDKRKMQRNLLIKTELKRDMQRHLSVYIDLKRKLDILKLEEEFKNQHEMVKKLYEFYIENRDKVNENNKNI